VKEYVYTYSQPNGDKEPLDKLCPKNYNHPLDGKLVDRYEKVIKV
jgi:hypothetical protein